MQVSLTSKITWINIIGLVVTLLSAVASMVTPEQAVYLATAIQILTVILRQLQGKEINLGGKTFKL